MRRVLFSILWNCVGRRGWLCTVLIIGFATGQPDHNAAHQSLEESLKRFLRSFDNDKAARYMAAFYDLNGDRVPEAVVYLISNEQCGSGGCTTLILTRAGSSWKIVTEVSITRPPIRVLTAKSNGWHNIGVWVQGGGIQPGYEAELRFDGRTYPENPSTPPAERMVKKVGGKVVVASAVPGVPLYSARPGGRARARAPAPL